MAKSFAVSPIGGILSRRKLPFSTSHLLVAASIQRLVNSADKGLPESLSQLRTTLQGYPALECGAFNAAQLLRLLNPGAGPSSKPQ